MLYLLYGVEFCPWSLANERQFPDLLKSRRRHWTRFSVLQKYKTNKIFKNTFPLSFMMIIFLSKHYCILIAMNGLIGIKLPDCRHNFPLISLIFINSPTCWITSFQFMKQKINLTQHSGWERRGFPLWETFRDFRSKLPDTDRDRPTRPSASG